MSAVVTPVSLTAQTLADTSSLIDPALIDIRPGHRQHSPDAIAAMACSIVEHGLAQPIELVRTGDRFLLASGRLRLEALRALGQTYASAHVRSIVEHAAEATAMLLGIVENMVRVRLSALDRAFAVAEWRDVYTSAQGVIQRGRPAKRKLSQVETISDAEREAVTEAFAASFSEAVQKAFGLKRPAIYRDLAVASIGQALRERISLHPIADNQSELLHLAREPADRRDGIAALLLSEPAQAGSVSEAIAILDRLPKPTALMRWEKLSGTFSRLTEPQQHRFFELHADAIELWLAKRREGGAR